MDSLKCSYEWLRAVRGKGHGHKIHVAEGKAVRHNRFGDLVPKERQRGDSNRVRRGRREGNSSRQPNELVKFIQCFDGRSLV